MKVLDPQEALLTTSEVHQFLSKNPPRPQQKKIGSYRPVNLKNYERVRQDFQHYVKTTIPYVQTLPPPDTFVTAVVPKLRAFGVTKTEALMLINLGVGLPRNQSSKPGVNDESAAASNGEEEEAAGEEEEEEEEEEAQEPDDRSLLSLVIEEVEDRFPGEQGEAKIDRILETMRTEYDRAHAAHAAANGGATNISQHS